MTATGQQPTLPPEGHEQLSQIVEAVPQLIEEQIEKRFTEPLHKRGWLWRGRPLDLFALIVVVLGVQSSFGIVIDLFAGNGSSSVAASFARSGPILLVGLMAAFITVRYPEAWSGRRSLEKTKNQV